MAAGEFRHHITVCREGKYVEKFVKNWMRPHVPAAA